MPGETPSHQGPGISAGPPERGIGSDAQRRCRWRRKCGWKPPGGTCCWSSPEGSSCSCTSMKVFLTCTRAGDHNCGGKFAPARASVAERKVPSVGRETFRGDVSSDTLDPGGGGASAAVATIGPAATPL
eukprot:CAMPEP_0115263734 /NCGR_PEP_ID=MMETSP0270-20121206/50066_1 /TAXON_ID=71861 /ORGANISM="Scrippsiella trochoidea, Strain CCMP3099" /LENGTH=128 /DNA_ID=CAMNT_0002679731 /DNA_START=34 /DNA_END=417 /DNA_ORIENTATION=-